MPRARGDCHTASASWRKLDASRPLSYICHMENVHDRMIIPKEFPELNLLVWNRDPARPITRDVAFALYERNWRFVDADRLTPREAALVRDLAGEFGHGQLPGA